MLTQHELEQRLLAACNGLRGPVDPTDYKAYIFPLLFLKRISDKWDWEHRRALEKFDGDEELARLDENHQFVIPDGCHWLDVLKLVENVGSGLHKILQRIEQANPETLAGIFGDVQWANKDKLPELALKNVLKEFSSLNLDPEHAPGDVLGAAYEYLLKYFADESGKKAGEFFTPRFIVRLLTLILDPQEGESAHDPACGSGGMLVEMMNVLREHGGDPRTVKLSGQEVSLTTASIARMNLFLHGIDDFRIRRGDTLRDPKFRTPDGDLEKFDMVIANPPFSLSPWGRDQWVDDPFGRAVFGLPPDQYGDYAFVQHMVACLADGGRLAVVMPQGVLFRGATEHTVRKALLEAGIIEAVIGLPPNVFYNTPLPACILVCRRGDIESTDVIFVDGSSCFRKQAARNTMTDTDVEDILEAYRTRTTTGRAVVRTATLELIKSRDWDLDLQRYVSNVESAPDLAGAYSSYVSSRIRLVEADAQLVAAVESARFLKDGQPLGATSPPSADIQRALARVTDAVEGVLHGLEEALAPTSALLTAVTRHLCPTSTDPGVGVPLSSLADYINGRAFKPAVLGKVGLPVIRIRQLLDPTADLDYFDGDYDDKHYLRDGDLVFSWSATLAVERWWRGPALLNQHLFRVVERDGVERDWLTYVLRSALPHLNSMTHGTTMKHITKKSLDEVFVALPDPSDQQAVVTTLEALASKLHPATSS